MENKPKYPWRIDTNDRYRELVGILINLSTAALILPIFFTRDFFGIPSTSALIDVLPPSAYFAWVCFGFSILAGMAFYFFSAKWARLAWQQPVGLFGRSMSENAVEHALEISLWVSIAGFLSGDVLTLIFLVANAPSH